MKIIVSTLLAVMMLLALLIPASAAGVPEYDGDTGITTLMVFDCDRQPNGSNAFSVDTGDKTQGAASISFNVGHSSINEMVLPEEVDGTDLDTLEFDLYVSDVKLFELFGVKGQMDSGLEITSSGRSDNQEIAWTLENISFNNRGEPLKEGWNHVILPLNSGEPKTGDDPALQGDFDISCVNFMRFYMVGETTTYNITVKIDNICLSDWNAVTTAAMKEAAAKKKAEEFVADVEALAEVTAENYTTIKADVEALRTSYSKLNDIAKDYVTKAAMDKLEAAEAKIADFEANPPSDEEPKEEQPPVVEEPKTGCGASVALGGVAILALAGAMMLKKKED
jgi:hypothetical protein